MQCTCITDLEKKLADHMKPQAGDSAEASCITSAFYLDTAKWVLNIPFRITGDKKGFTSLRGKRMTVKASYCPFCGKPTAQRPDQAVGDGASEVLLPSGYLIPKPEAPTEAPAAS